MKNNNENQKFDKRKKRRLKPVRFLFWSSPIKNYKAAHIFEIVTNKYFVKVLIFSLKTPLPPLEGKYIFLVGNGEGVHGSWWKALVNKAQN